MKIPAARPSSVRAAAAPWALFVLFCSSSIPRETAAAGSFSTGQLIESHGHPGYSKHSVLTEDGYFVNLFHIKGHEDGPPFLLLHALMGASDQWFLRDKYNDLPSVLANNGYDVWLGDFRGNVYSTKHSRLNISDPEYWKFSVDEWAYYDTPAMIDFVQNHTNYEKMYLVTYSMSSTIFLATASARPEYNDKIIVSYHMAPFVAYTHIQSFLVRLGVRLGQLYLPLARHIKRYQLFPRNPLATSSISLFCNKNSIFLNVCISVLKEMFGLDTVGNSTSNLEFKLAHSRAGLSLNSVDHLIQLILTNKFQHYDFGAKKNMKKYGQPKPPEYDLRKVTSPVVLFYSKNDRVIDSGTINKLISVLPNVYRSITIPSENFGHLDYAFNSNAKSFVFDLIVDIARQFSPTQSRPRYTNYYYYY